MLRSSDENEVIRGAVALAEMNLFLAEQFIQAGRLALPEEWDKHPAKKLGYAQSLSHFASPKFELAHEALLFCQEAMAETSRDDSTLKRFEELSARANLAVEREQQPRVAFHAPEIANSTDGACRFRGFASELNAPVETADGALVLGLVEAAGFDSLSLPDATTGTYSARLAWPLRGEVRLRAERLVRLKQELSMVPSHIWYPAGAPLDLTQGKAGTAFLVSDFEELVRGSALEISCNKLSLKSSEGSLFAPSPTARRLRKAESLFRSPRGPLIAKVGGALSGVEVLERDGEWVHVRSENNPYVMFQGWLSDVEFEPEGLQVGVDSVATVEAQHRVRRESALYLGGVNSGLVVSAGVPVRVLATEWEFSLVVVPGFRAPSRAGYWLKSEDLELIKSEARETSHTDGQPSEDP